MFISPSFPNSTEMTKNKKHHTHANNFKIHSSAEKLQRATATIYSHEGFLGGMWEQTKGKQWGFQSSALERKTEDHQKGEFPSRRSEKFKD